MRVLVPAVAAASLFALSTDAWSSGDADRGEFLFGVRCAHCHMPDMEENLAGPHLVGIFGREAGSVEGFDYSSAVQESGIVWDEESIDAFIERPAAFLPGTTDPRFIANPADCADIIAYLKTLAKSD